MLEKTVEKIVAKTVDWQDKKIKKAYRKQLRRFLVLLKRHRGRDSVAPIRNTLHATFENRCCPTLSHLVGISELIGALGVIPPELKDGEVYA